jgi:phosphoribosyl-ATP pyrophosphohydrolase
LSGKLKGEPKAAAIMKHFEDLFKELSEKVQAGDPASGTVRLVREGRHAIGKKLLEEAGEAWMAAEYESPEKTAEELSQLLYHVQVMMLACGLRLEDVYRYL